MYPGVAQVEALEDFTLALVFDNGEQGVLDMKPYLVMRPFSKLADPKCFKAVVVSFDTIAWGEDVDLDPEFVYAKCQIGAET